MNLNQRQIRALHTLIFARSPQRKWYAALVLILALLGAAWSQFCRAAGQIEGLVVGVADGDTITVLDGSRRQHKIRFAFVDAPEAAQAFGQIARKALYRKVYKQRVKVEVIEQDQYGRSVGRVWLGGTDINLAQLAEGYAWHYQYFASKTQSSSDFQRYAELQQRARSQRLGLWQDRQPVPPWNFRRANPRSGASPAAIEIRPGEPESPMPESSSE